MTRVSLPERELDSVIPLTWEMGEVSGAAIINPVSEEAWSKLGESENWIVGVVGGGEFVGSI